MKSSPRKCSIGLIAVVLAAGLLMGTSHNRVRGDDPLKKQANAWQLDEALQQLALHPHDSYLQYVALQLSKRDRREEEVNNVIAMSNRPALFEARGRAGRADLFSTFTGALAIQESLQLDSMRGPNPAPDRLGGPKLPQPGKKLPEKVAVAALTGPEVQSHPWEKMLGDKKPEVGTLSKCVPDDFWFAEFRSLAKLNEVLGAGELFGGHIFAQALGDASSPVTVERIKRQLGIFPLPPKALEAIPVEGVAVCGSDLFLSEGSDVTVVVQSKKLSSLTTLFGSLIATLNQRGKMSDGTYVGIAYQHFTTPDGTVNVYYADVKSELHVRSNSLPAFQRVLEAIAGKTPQDKPAKRLGDNKEFQYIRTLLPRGAAEEDGLIYLSDPFIRRMVGPALKLTEM
jgi:hypothetical protein